MKEWSGDDTEVSLKSETGDVTLVLQKDGNTCELRDNTGATVETGEFVYDPSMGVLSVTGVPAERALRFTFTDEASDGGTYTFELGDDALDSLLELANAAGEEND
ncbi:MAG: hypothetical protein LIO51_05695 [Clostridiales bacterium]|nr:hypothetical protein [Clostridiales bacterium]